MATKPSGYGDEELAEIIYLFQGVVELALQHEMIPEEKIPMYRRVRPNFWEATKARPNREFRIAFRMHRLDYRHLVDKVRVKLTANAVMADLRNGPIEPEVRIAIVLRILSGASYLDLMLLWQLGRSTVYNVFHSTVVVLNQTFF